MHPWERWNDAYEAGIAPAMRWLIDNARIAPGMTVLDVACGTGQPAIPAARIAAKVVGVDVSAEMLAGAARLAQARGVTNLELVEADMHDLGALAARGPFDAATCGFVLMFSPDPRKALGSIRHVLRPGAGLSACVWAEPAGNPFLTVMFGVLGKHASLPPPDPTAPGPFRLAAPAELASIARDVGLRDVAVERVEMLFEQPSLDDFCAMMIDMAGPVRTAVAKMTAAAATAFRADVAAAYAPFVDGGVVRVPIALNGLRATA